MHPQRWTGRDLAADAKAADNAARGHLEANFEEFYRLRYPQLCWHVHGSGAIMIADIPADLFAFAGGRAYCEAANFAAAIAEVEALHSGFWNASDFKALRDTMIFSTGMVLFGIDGGGRR